MTVAMPSKEDFAALLNESFKVDSLAEGAVIKGTIVAIEKDLAVIDVGLKTEGRVPLKEFAVAGRDAAGDQGVGELVAQPVEFGIGQGGFAHPQRHLVRIAFGVQARQVADDAHQTMPTVSA